MLARCVARFDTIGAHSALVHREIAVLVVSKDGRRAIAKNLVVWRVWRRVDRTVIVHVEHVRGLFVKVALVKELLRRGQTSAIGGREARYKHAGWGLLSQLRRDLRQERHRDEREHARAYKDMLDHVECSSVAGGMDFVFAQAR